MVLLCFKMNYYRQWWQSFHELTDTLFSVSSKTRFARATVRNDGVHALGVDVIHGNCWITFVLVLKKNNMICDRLKSKRRVFAELRLVRGFIRANASQMSCGRSQNLLYATPSGSKISPPLFVKFHHHKVSVLNDYLCVKKEIFQFYFIWSQIDQFKKDDSILS